VVLDAAVVELLLELEESDEVEVPDGVDVLEELLDESVLGVELELEPPRLSVL
jgi:hypothetical protein